MNVVVMKRERPSRVARRQVAAHFQPEVGRALRTLAAESDTTVQALLAEALADLFDKHGKHEIAAALRPIEPTPAASRTNSHRALQRALLPLVERALLARAAGERDHAAGRVLAAP